ncbi:hypothetical protein M4I21_10505 [Cellulophaga sp. 20_2_10]|uniref:hypothetical protein n=1 Tax=Cellulophaga sp. 20_2_10 TaxID=2942476 RepID=UPI00201AD55B|nr:hypothetical protein [Cellulophaga sp. 20_2_10]MCL5246240.1 hypothetical protein [Cellulophaga sp. 20_2_10]
MMIKNSVLLISLFTILNSCNSQKKEDPLITEINTGISEIENLIKGFNSPLGISLSLGDSEPFNPENKHNFEDKKEQQSDSIINAFIDSIAVDQTIIEPYNSIDIDFDDLDIIQRTGINLFHYHDHPEDIPFYTMKNITFLDGTTTKAKGKNITDKEIMKRYYNGEELSDIELYVENKQAFKECFIIKDDKPVKSIEFEFTRFKRNRKTYTLKTKGDIINTKYGTIYLDGITNNSIALRVPTEIADFTELNALYKDGRSLKRTGGSESTSFSNKKKEYYKSYIDVLKKAKVEVAEKRIQTEKQLLKYLEKQSIPFKEDIAYTLLNVNYKGPVNSLKLTVSDIKSQKITHNVTYNFKIEDILYKEL